jgi:hypothetical protein
VAAAATEKIKELQRSTSGLAGAIDPDAMPTTKADDKTENDTVKADADDDDDDDDDDDNDDDVVEDLETKTDAVDTAENEASEESKESEPIVASPIKVC